MSIVYNCKSCISEINVEDYKKSGRCYWCSKDYEEVILMEKMNMKCRKEVE